MPKHRLPDHLQMWIDARKRFHLSHAHVQMARELGLNPKKMSRIAAAGADGRVRPRRIGCRSTCFI